jgi:hypothetical protein
MSVDNSPRPLAGAGDPPRRVGEGFADFAPRIEPVNPGSAVLSTLGEDRCRLQHRSESKCKNSRTGVKPTGR